MNDMLSELMQALANDPDILAIQKQVGLKVILGMKIYQEV